MSNFVLDDIIEEPKERRRGWNDRTEEEKIQLTKSLYVSFYGSYLNKINLFLLWIRTNNIRTLSNFF